MFKLEKKQLKLKSLNARKEFHGDEKKLAIDLNFIGTFPSTVLNFFGEGLIEKFWKAKPVEEKDLIDQVSDDVELTVLAMPHLKNKNYELDFQGAGYRMGIEIGISGVDNIYLINCTLSKFKFEPKEGGSVDLEFKLSSYPNQYTAEEVAQLAPYIDEVLYLDLTPPTAEEQAQMEIDEATENAA